MQHALLIQLSLVLAQPGPTPAAAVFSGGCPRASQPEILTVPPLAPQFAAPSVTAAPVSRCPPRLAAAGLLGAGAQAPTQRPRAIEYSGFYGVRLTIHRYASYATLPLFAAQYVTGDQLMRKSSDAPRWARDLHGPLATGLTGLFALNTVTGLWNFWDSRNDPSGRARRTIHTVLMLAADAGFAWSGVLAEQAEQSAEKRELHRTVALTSVGVSTVGYLMMLIWKD